MHSALRRAIEQDNLRAVTIALAHGADVEEVDIHGDAGLPLRIACYRGQIEIVQMLIKAGANIHAPNAQGSGGPLRSALRGKHLHIVELLLQLGAEMPPDVTLPKDEPAERRKRNDRRKRNQGPPSGLRERRFARERRTTSVEVIQLDDNQWETYFSQSQTEPPQPEKTPFPTLHFDDAAMILGRARR